MLLPKPQPKRPTNPPTPTCFSSWMIGGVKLERLGRGRWWTIRPRRVGFRGSRGRLGDPAAFTKTRWAPRPSPSGDEVDFPHWLAPNTPNATTGAAGGIPGSADRQALAVDGLQQVALHLGLSTQVSAHSLPRQHVGQLAGLGGDPLFRGRGRLPWSCS